MKVLVYGEHWEGTHAWLLRREFENHGYEARVFDFLPQVYFQDGFSLTTRIARRACRQASRLRINRRFLEAVEEWGPSIVVISKGADLHRSTIEALKRRGIYIVHWSPDDYCNEQNTSRDLLESIPLFDLIVSARPFRFDVYRGIGARDLLYVDWYFSPEIHHPEKCSVDLDGSFVGSWSPDRERFLGSVGCPIDIFGGGWEKASTTRIGHHRIHPGALGPRDYRRVICGSRFSINLFTGRNFDVSNQRIFEVAACAGLLTSQRTAFAEELFGDRLGYLAFETPTDLEAILRSEGAFDKIRECGRRAVVDARASFRERFEILQEAILDRMGR